MVESREGEEEIYFVEDLPGVGVLATNQVEKNRNLRFGTVLVAGGHWHM